MDWETARLAQERLTAEAAARNARRQAELAAREAARSRARRELDETLARVGAWLTAYVTEAERHGVRTVVTAPPGEFARIDEVYFVVEGTQLRLRVPPAVTPEGDRVDDHAYIALGAPASDPEGLQATWLGETAYHAERLGPASFGHLLNALRFHPAAAIVARASRPPRRWNPFALALAGFALGASLLAFAALRPAGRGGTTAPDGGPVPAPAASARLDAAGAPLGSASDVPAVPP